MEPICKICSKAAEISCSCEVNLMFFCKACTLNHMLTKKSVHTLELILQNTICEECHNKKIQWNCECKGLKTGLCNNCVLLHVNKLSNTSHNFKIAQDSYNEDNSLLTN